MKPFKDLDSLVELLSSRGLSLPAPDVASRILHDLNYYRFSGYARQFQIEPSKGKNDFLPGMKFEDICSHIAADEQFRSIMWDALRVVELSVRARFAHELGRDNGEDAFYLDSSSYLTVMKDQDRFLARLREDLSRSKSPMIARYKDESSLDKVPIWVAVEVMSFGSIAKMLNYLSDKEPAKRVASSYSIKWEGFGSTIHSLSVLRNSCAHHSQIWHRTLDIQCPTQKRDRPRGVEYNHQGPYSAVIALKVLMKSITKTTEWAERVDSFLTDQQTYAAGIYQPFAK